LPGIRTASRRRPLPPTLHRDGKSRSAPAAGKSPTPERIHARHGAPSSPDRPHSVPKASAFPSSPTTAPRPRCTGLTKRTSSPSPHRRSRNPPGPPHPEQARDDIVPRSTESRTFRSAQAGSRHQPSRSRRLAPTARAVRRTNPEFPSHCDKADRKRESRSNGTTLPSHDRSPRSFDRKSKNDISASVSSFSHGIRPYGGLTYRPLERRCRLTTAAPDLGTAKVRHYVRRPRIRGLFA
jgi:hypothetical protein